MGNLAMGASLGDDNDYYRSYLLAFSISKLIIVVLYLKAIRNDKHNSSMKYCIYFIISSFLETLISFLFSFIVSVDNAGGILMFIYGFYYFFDQFLWSLLSSLRVKVTVRAWGHMVQRLNLLSMVMLAVLMVYLIVSLNTKTNTNLTILEKLFVVTAASLIIYYVASLYMRDGFASWMKGKNVSPDSETRSFQWFFLQEFHVLWFFCLLGFAIGMDLLTDEWENAIIEFEQDQRTQNCTTIPLSSGNNNNNNNGTTAFNTTTKCNDNDSFFTQKIAIKDETIYIFTISLFIACVMLNIVRFISFLERHRLEDVEWFQWAVCGVCTLILFVVCGQCLLRPVCVAAMCIPLMIICDVCGVFDVFYCYVANIRLEFIFLCIIGNVGSGITNSNMDCRYKNRHPKINRYTIIK